MDAKIDYLSFTIMTDVRGAGDELQMWLRAVNVVWQRVPAFAEWAEQAQNWEAGGARGHYAFSQFNRQFFTAVRFGGKANHILFELPGTTCQALRDVGLLDQVLREAADRLTRLDLAVDIPGGCSPREFVAAGYNARFKSYTEIVSAEGETEYVGSMKSERYARVYRYNEPHPRAGTLRVEHVFRSDYAKAAGQMIVSDGLLAAADASGNTWGWQAADWQPAGLTDGKVRAHRADRHEPGRVRWLHKVCIPALVKAEREGLIDLDVVIENLLSLRKAQQPPGLHLVS